MGWGDGQLFVGDDGMLISDYGRHVLLPEEKFVDFVPPAKSIPDSIGHHREWIEACKTGSPTTCNFAYSGALTEAVLLGNVAFRVGRPLDWDAKNLQATNAPEAAELVRIPCQVPLLEGLGNPGHRPEGHRGLFEEAVHVVGDGRRSGRRHSLTS